MGGVALFDMDRTLIRKDTAGLFIRYEYDIGRASRSSVLRVLWWQIRYRLGVLDIDQVAERVLTWYRGRSEAELREQVATWFGDRVKLHISAAARAAVKSHLDQGDLVAIASGATRYACEPTAAEFGIEHIVCTELEALEGFLTGRARLPLCYGRGKLLHSEQFLRAHGKTVKDATVYSDSITDLPLLEAAGIPVVINPDPRLEVLAQRRGWRIERW